jgi:hypothetical protein
VFIYLLNYLRSEEIIIRNLLTNRVVMNLRGLCLIRLLLLLSINRSTTLQSEAHPRLVLQKKKRLSRNIERYELGLEVVSLAKSWTSYSIFFLKRKHNQRTRRGSRAGGRSGGWRAGRQWAWPPFMDFLSTETGGPIAFLTLVAFLTPECTPAYTHLGSNVRIGRVWNVLLRIGRKTTCYARVRLTPSNTTWPYSRPHIATMNKAGLLGFSDAANNSPSPAHPRSIGFHWKFTRRELTV